MATPRKQPHEKMKPERRQRQLTRAGSAAAQLRRDRMMLAAFKGARAALENAYGAIGPETPSSLVKRDMERVETMIRLLEHCT
jgi:hypothetical protein